ncbi:MAG TPA: LysR family transcriptional regulator [Acidimicrobiales bacterium]|nr:LysR family transcriptional regulator [Acidimicrobiales bacterium]
MDLRQLSALVAVADEGSFSAAAAALHTVQSNVSTHIARLERELHSVLVDRSAGRLTEEGEAVANRARRIKAELDGLVADVAALHDVVSGTVRMGVIGTTARWLVPLVLEAMSERHPEVQLSVVDATTTSLEPQLASGQLDLAVVNLPVPAPDLMTEPLFDEDLVLVVPSDHPLASRTHVALKDLDGLELLMAAPNTSYRREVDAASAAAGITLIPKAELDGVRLMASLTFEGHGPAIVPATAIPQWLPQGRWTAVTVHGLPLRKVGLAQRRRGLPAAPARALIDILREVIGAATTTQPGVHPPG